MKICEAPVTGAGYQPLVQDPGNALEQFYHAFNSRDMALMGNNWMKNDDISMSNPLGGVWRGWVDIEALYRRIFCRSVRVYVEFHDYSLHVTEGVFLAVGRERATVRQHGESMQLAIRTSRLYRRQDGQWLQWHHHGSIEDPGSLACYQQWLAASRPYDNQ